MEIQDGPSHLPCRISFSPIHADGTADTSKAIRIPHCHLGEMLKDNCGITPTIRWTKATATITNDLNLTNGRPQARACIHQKKDKATMLIHERS